MADVKGDLSGLAKAGGDSPKIAERLKDLKLEGFAYDSYPVALWDVFGEKGHPIRTTVTEMGPLLLSRILNLNETQIVNDKKPAAEATLQQIIDLDKQDKNSRLLLARLLSEHPDKEQDVLNLLDETARISPDKPEALELATKIDTQFPKLVLGKLLQGDVYLAEKKLDKATDMYQQAYKIQPNDKVLFTLVDLLNAQGKHTDAIKLLNNALVKNNKNGAVHFKLATVYQQQNDNKQAEAHYNAILTEQPDNVLAS